MLLYNNVIDHETIFCDNQDHKGIVSTTAVLYDLNFGRTVFTHVQA